MSLFPAAAADLVKVKMEKNDSGDLSDWLKNQSFHPDKAEQLAKQRNIKHETDEDSSDVPDDVHIKGKKKKKTKKRKHSPHSGECHIPVKQQIKPQPRNDHAKDQKLSVIVDQLNDDTPRFCPDEVPDMDNLHFGRPYKVHAPKYYRNLLYCVGTPKWKFIMMKQKRKKKKRIIKDEGRYFSTDAKRYTGGLSAKCLCQDDPMTAPITENYMKLPNENVGEMCENGNDPCAKSEDSDIEMRKRTESLNRRTREDPQDVEGWLELVAWQDEVLKDTLVHGRSRITCEKKIEILNHAIKANPKAAQLQLMKVAMLPEVLSDIDTIDKEWQNLLFRFPDNIEVWQKYIFHITCNSYNAFSMRRTRRAFAHCIEILRSIKAGTYKQHTSQTPIEQRLVQVFTQYTDFLHATGHTEQWVALFQCILELNFRGPMKKTPMSETVDDLHKYFSSEEKKLGETGSKGFQQWLCKHERGGWVTHDANDVNGQGEDTKDDDDEDVDVSLTLVENWLKLEQGRSERHWLPWQPSFDGDECEDEERKVSFSGIKDLMFIVDEQSSKMELLRHLLHLLGCQSRYHTTKSYPFSDHHPFYYLHPHDVMKARRDCYLPDPLLYGHGTVQHSVSHGNYCMGCRSGALSSAKHKFVSEVFSQLLLCTDDKTLKTFLSCEYMRYHEHRVICFYLMKKAQSLKKSGKEARKVAKLILGCDPGLLWVWCGLGVVEWLVGKRNEACKIFQTTLSMSIPLLQKLDRESRRRKLASIYFICRTFAELHFFTCEECGPTSPSSFCGLLTHTVSTLAALGDGCKFSECVPQGKEAMGSTKIMKARSGFARLVEELESLYQQEEYDKEMNGHFKGPLSSYADVICCQIVFSIISSSPVRDKFTNAESFLHKQIAMGSTQAKCDLERLKYLEVCVLRQDLAKNRRLYRDVVYSAATEFPNNPIYSQMLCEIDISSYISGNVRKHFAKACAQNPNSVVPWLCATHFELLRRRRILAASMAEQGTNETGRLMDARIRNLFEHSLSVTGNSGCVVLWRAYIVAETEMCPDRVHGLYTRALDACSWSRDLYLDILPHQPQLLNDVVENLSKKGLRLRTPVEEVQLLMSVG